MCIRPPGRPSGKQPNPCSYHKCLKIRNVDGPVCKPRVLGICMILHHLTLFPNTLLYMSDHHSVDTAAWVSQANEQPERE